MTIALWCIYLAALLLIVTKAPLAKAQNDAAGGYDNHNPRVQQAALTGWGERALAAHQNQMEAFPLFATGVIVASLYGSAQGTLDLLAISWVVLRLLYTWLYLIDKPTLRSTIWGLSYGISLALLCGPAWMG